MRKAATGHLSEDERATFLACLEAGMLIADAAAVIGASVSILYKYRSEDPEFRADWEFAYMAGTDYFAREAARRAVDGSIEPVFHMGKVVGGVRKYSDTLLMMLMKARDPTRYCDRARTLELEAARAAREAELGKADPTAHTAALEAIAALERLAMARAAEATDTLRPGEAEPCPTAND